MGVGGSSPLISTRAGIRAHLASFLRVHTSVIYALVNSLVFTLKSPRSATRLPALEAWQGKNIFIAILENTKGASSVLFAFNVALSEVCCTEFKRLK